jgi:hypothetical protein
MESRKRLTPKRGGWGARFPVFVDFTFELARSGTILCASVLQAFLLVLFLALLRWPTCGEAGRFPPSPTDALSLWAITITSIITSLFSNLRYASALWLLFALSFVVAELSVSTLTTLTTKSNPNPNPTTP